MARSRPTQTAMEMHSSCRGGDQNIAQPRPVYLVNSSSPGTDLWCSASAAFAMASILYSFNTTYSPSSSATPPSNPSLSSPSYSSTLLDHAERLYRVANSTSLQSFADSVPDATSSYGSSGFGDDIAVAALTLAIATNSSAYYRDAYNAYAKYRLTGTSFVYNWDSRTPGLFVLFAEASQARPQLAEGAGLDRNVSGWQAEAENYFDRVINSRTSNTRMTNGECWRSCLQGVRGVVPPGSQGMSQTVGQLARYRDPD